MKIKKILSLLACLSMGIFACKAAPPGNDVLDPQTEKIIEEAEHIIMNYMPEQHYPLKKIAKTCSNDSFTPDGVKWIPFKQAFPKVAPKKYKVKNAPYVPRENLAKAVIEATEIFKKEKPLVEIRSKKGILFGSDFHGDSDSLKNFLLMYCKLMRLGVVDTAVVSGDFTDREFYGAETLYLLYTMKKLMPDSIYIFRGNHENLDLQSKQNYNTLMSELKNKYNVIDYEDELLKSIDESYRYLPVAAVASLPVKISKPDGSEHEENHKYFCVHGGLAEEILGKGGVEVISKIPMPFPSDPFLSKTADDKSVNHEEPDGKKLSEQDTATDGALEKKKIDDEKKLYDGLVHQLTWNEGRLISESRDDVEPSGRGEFAYGGKKITDFLAANGFNGIVSGHTHKSMYDLFDVGDGRQFSQLTVLSSEKYGGEKKCKGCAGIISNEIDFNEYPVPIPLKNWQDIVDQIEEDSSMPDPSCFWGECPK